MPAPGTICRSEERRMLGQVPLTVKTDLTRQIKGNYGMQAGCEDRGASQSVEFAEGFEEANQPSSRKGEVRRQKSICLCLSPSHFRLRTFKSRYASITRQT